MRNYIEEAHCSWTSHKEFRVSSGAQKHSPSCSDDQTALLEDARESMSNCFGG
jgi:hypothetical protein